MAIKKWQNKVRMKRIIFPLGTSSTSKGYFVVYTIDNRRFVVPLEYLNNTIFKELLRMSEEEFGLPGNRPITLPCDSIFMDYVISFLRQQRNPRRCLSENFEKSFFLIMMSNNAGDYYRPCSMSSTVCNQQQHQQLLLHGF